MNWDAAIERNREALKRILATLVAMAGLADVASPSPLWGGARGGGTLPRHLHRTILRLLRPAEAAARRLVIVVARDLVLPPPPPRKSKPKPPSIFVRKGDMRYGIVLPYGVKPGDVLPNLAKPRRPPPHALMLPLFDTPQKWPGSSRRPVRNLPRIWSPGLPDRAPARRPPQSDDAIDSTRLALRLNAVGRALDDLPRQAMRFARRRARLEAATQDIRHAFGEQDIRQDAGAAPQVAWLPRRLSPLRPGRPPGGRRKPTHEVHEVLADLQYFAQRALERRDSS